MSTIINPYTGNLMPVKKQKQLTAPEVKTLYESNPNTNEFSDIEQGKLATIEVGATADQTKADIDALNINADTVDGLHANAFEQLANKGALNGYPPLQNGTIPATYLPAYIDTIVEFPNFASFPTTGAVGTIYVDASTSKSYRWSGSTYTAIVSGAVASVNGQVGVVNLTKSSIGLPNVDNTADVNKPVSNATQAALNQKLGVNDIINADLLANHGIGDFELVANKGIANGYTPLDTTGKVPLIYLPSYVDAITEYPTPAAFPTTGSSGTIYVDLSTGDT